MIHRPSFVRARVFVGLVAMLACACNKSDTPAGDAKNPPPAPPGTIAIGSARTEPTAAATAPVPGLEASTVPGQTGSCGHAVCDEDFFVDAVAPPACAGGATCTVALRLVALGPYHMNDEYPYKFVAANAEGVTFAGTDPGGKQLFTKTAGDWHKTNEKSGELVVKFTPEKGPRTVTGTFKLSVCSAEKCLLEQRPIAASFVAQ